MAKEKKKSVIEHNRESILYAMSNELINLKTALKDGLVIQAYERILQLQEYIYNQQQVK